MMRVGSRFSTTGKWVQARSSCCSAICLACRRSNRSGELGYGGRFCQTPACQRPKGLANTVARHASGELGGRAAYPGQRPAIALARAWSPSGFRDRVCPEGEAAGVGIVGGDRDVSAYARMAPYASSVCWSRPDNRSGSAKSEQAPALSVGLCRARERGPSRHWAELPAVNRPRRIELSVCGGPADRAASFAPRCDDGRVPLSREQQH